MTVSYSRPHYGNSSGGDGTPKFNTSYKNKTPRAKAKNKPVCHREPPGSTAGVQFATSKVAESCRQVLEDENSLSEPPPDTRARNMAWEEQMDETS